MLLHKDNLIKYFQAGVFLLKCCQVVMFSVLNGIEQDGLVIFSIIGRTLKWCFSCGK